jgi:hypothetical protein
VLVGYFKPNKAKAKSLLEAFIAGAPRPSYVHNGVPKQLVPGDVAFYGVTPELVHLWEQAKAEGRTWYYIDNAYLDPCREQYFRITKNALQITGTGFGPPSRFDALKINIEPWRKGGEHILVCPQSDQFMKYLAGYTGNWTEDTIAELRKRTDRKIIVHAWNRDKRMAYRELPVKLRGAHCLVTWSSAAATTAVLCGVPAIVLAEQCATRAVASTTLDEIETPRRPDNRYEWACCLAQHQFNYMEMKNGHAYRIANLGEHSDSRRSS